MSTLSRKDFKNCKLNLKPQTLRESIRKFKKLKFESSSSCDIKGKYWGEAASRVMASG